MGRKENKYFLSSALSYFSLKELEELFNIPKKVIYERIHKYHWDLEKAINTPVKKRSLSNKSINQSTNSKPNIENNDFFDINENINSNIFCQPDFIGIDETNTFFLVKLIDTKEYQVNPHTSHPNRYPVAWYMFYSLLSIAKKLNGYLYVINYDSSDDSKFRVLKVSNYNELAIISHLKTNSNYSDYLTIEDDLLLNKEEFIAWFNNLLYYNKSYRNKIYKRLKNDKNVTNVSFNRPKYWKEPIKCSDHLGNTFYSKSAMCSHYNISPNVYYNRIKANWSLEKALTTPVSKRKRKSH